MSFFQYSMQDNGSAKFFQGALHTPNMGEKVAQVSLLIIFLICKITFNSLYLPTSVHILSLFDF